MKKIAITISLLAGATVGYSQGTLNWSDYVTAAPPLPGFSITIWGPQSAGAAPVNNLGNTSGDTPGGTAHYTGTPLSGAGYEVGLYVDSTATAVGTDVTSGTPLSTANFTAGSGGWYFGSTLTVTDPSAAGGTGVFVELAAWSTAIGSPASYAAAVAAGDLAGHSLASTGTAPLGGGSPPTTPGTLAGIGLTDFAIGTATPEPSTIALGVIGASAFLMRLRRKQ
jgi:hypothetical protein